MKYIVLFIIQLFFALQIQGQNFTAFFKAIEDRNIISNDVALKELRYKKEKWYSDYFKQNTILALGFLRSDFEKNTPNFRKYHPVAITSIDSLPKDLEFHKSNTKFLIEKLYEFEIISFDAFQKVKKMADDNTIMHPCYLFYSLALYYVDQDFKSQASMLKMLEAYKELFTQSQFQELKNGVLEEIITIEDIYREIGDFKSITYETADSFEGLAMLFQNILRENFDPSAKVSISDSIIQKRNYQVFEINRDGIKQAYKILYIPDARESMGNSTFRLSDNFIAYHKFLTLVNQFYFDSGNMGRVAIIDYNHFLANALSGNKFKEGYDDAFSAAISYRFRGFLLYKTGFDKCLKYHAYSENRAQYAVLRRGFPQNAYLKTTAKFGFLEKVKSMNFYQKKSSIEKSEIEHYLMHNNFCDPSIVILNSILAYKDYNTSHEYERCLKREAPEEIEEKILEIFDDLSSGELNIENLEVNQTENKFRFKLKKKPFEYTLSPEKEAIHPFLHLILSVATAVEKTDSKLHIYYVQGPKEIKSWFGNLFFLEKKEQKKLTELFGVKLYDLAKVGIFD